MSIEDVFDIIRDILGIIREIVHFLKPIIEPILEVVNIISGLYTLVAFLEGFSLNVNNTSSLLVFVFSFLLMYLIEEEFYKWLRGLIGL